MVEKAGRYLRVHHFHETRHQPGVVANLASVIAEKGKLFLEHPGLLGGHRHVPQYCIAAKPSSPRPVNHSIPMNSTGSAKSGHYTLL